MVQQPSSTSTLAFDVTQWFSVLSEEASAAPTWKELHDYVMSWEERAAAPSHHRLLYSVNDWMEYIERLDDMITKTTTTTPQKQQMSSVAHYGHLQQRLLLQQARDWVGRRAVSHLPRSYKLWKSMWEFLISQFLNSHGHHQRYYYDHCRRVLQCFEQALLTLSHCPRVWVAYLQFVLAHPVPVLSVLSSTTTTTPAATTSISYHTHVRRLLNRALQSLPLTQHEKLWSDAGMVDYCFQQRPPKKSNENPNHDDDDDQNNMDIEKTSSHDSHGDYFWPFPTLNRILCRYAQFRTGHTTETTTRSFVSSSFPMDYATWCEQHEQYASAAAAYVAILNSYNQVATETSSTTDTIVVGRASYTDSQQRDVVFQSLMELVAQHADALSSHGTTTTTTTSTTGQTTIMIPWETIVQTTIQNEIRWQQQQQQHQQQPPTDDVRSTDSKTTRFLGMLYTWYASAYIQRGEYDMARSIYEEGLLQVMTVRDFTILYTAYLSFLEGLIQVLYDDYSEEEHSIDDPGDDCKGKHNNHDGDWDLLLLEQHDRKSNQKNIDDIEMAMLRAEYLIQRRALLLNAVKLRQNPNDAATYLERCELLLNHHKHNTSSTDSPKEGEQPQQVRPAIATLQDGLHRITNGGSSGTQDKGSSTTSSTVVTTIGDLALRLVQIYEESLHDIDGARQVFHSVCVQRTMAMGIVSTDEMAICWTKYVEFELKHEQYDTALSLARQSISPNPASTRYQRNAHSGTTSSDTKSVVARSLNLTKSLRLWDLLLDLEESLGTVQTTKDAYNRAIEIKAATVHHILNFASYLMEHQYYEESFTAYERGIELFAYPHPGAKLLWKAYIDAFIKRYKGTKVERVRNLFARCLEHCPASDCAEFFMIHGPYEEEYGLSKRALSVYKEMCEKVPVEDIYTAYQIFMTKTVKHRGIIATRDIYQDAIEKLAKVHPQSVVKICEDFAQMEVKLNQIDRARAIYVYGAQSADPRRIPEYWKGWNDFEIEYGSEDTFREMLRVKRSVEAAFSTINYNAVGMAQNVSNFTNEEAMSMIAAAEGMEYTDTSNVSASAIPVSGFVAAKITTSSTSSKRTVETLDDVEARVAQLRKVTGVTGSANPTIPLSTTTDHEYIDDDEIDLDELDAEIAEAAADGAIGDEAVTSVNEAAQ